MTEVKKWLSSISGVLIICFTMRGMQQESDRSLVVNGRSLSASFAAMLVPQVTAFFQMSFEGFRFGRRKLSFGSAASVQQFPQDQNNSGTGAKSDVAKRLYFFAITFACIC